MTGFTLDTESVRDIESRLREYLRQSGNLYSLTGGHEPPSEMLVECADPTVFHISEPNGNLIAELILSSHKFHRLFVELRTDPNLDDETRAELNARIDPSQWYRPVLLSLRKDEIISRPIIIDNISSTLNYFVPWLARRSTLALSTIPGQNADMEITELTGHESGISNPINVYQELVIRPRQPNLVEWRGKAIQYTLEEIAPGRIRLEAFHYPEPELVAVLFELKIKRILDTWPEAQCRTEVAKPENASADPTKTILFIASDPSDLSRLRLGKEVREISEKLQLAELRRFRLEQRHATRVSDLTQALLDTKPNIVHFSGHGTSEGALCLEDGSGLVHPVPPSALSALFGEFSGDVECVVLNVCYSEAQANSIAKHIPYVIGMNEDIPDQAAVAFSVGFYQALGAGRSIEKAYEMGCIQIALLGIPGQLTPVLVVAETLKTAQTGSAVGQP